VQEDHLYNCVTMLRRLRTQGYTGQISTLKQFVHPLRPPAARGRQPALRYETAPDPAAVLARDSRSNRAPSPASSQRR
jgi:hypothetical protein